MLPFAKKNIVIAASYAFVLALGIFLGQNFADEKDNLSNNAILPIGVNEKTSKLERMMQLIQQRYVDHIEIDTLQNFAMVEISKHLDPHSVYLPAQKAAEYSRNLASGFGGIGAEVYLLHDTLFIAGVSASGPAEKAGIRRGDKILWIDDTPVAGVNISFSKVSDLIRGKKGSLVKMWVKRKGVEVIDPFEVERDYIPTSSIESSYMVNPQTAYIKIRQFGANTAEEFLHILENLKKNKPKNLIIDLRDNGGGYFSEAMGVLEELLPQGSLMVYTKGVNDDRTDYFSAGGGSFEKGKIAVLIDENSASASEIVAGAIQDLNRGVVIGRRSFGKGLVQQKFDFSDGSAVNLSVARYYTPSGRSIQKPYKEGHIHYFNELNQRFLSGELTSGKVNNVDTIATDGRVYRTGTGKAMISGGGIMPDIYVKLDTTGVNKFYLDLVDSSLVDDYVYTYLVSKPPAYSLEKFINEYEIPSSVYPRLLEIAKRKGLSFGKAESNDCRSLVEADMKAKIGRYYFGDEAWYKIKNTRDGVISRSVEVLEKD
jgi:carboxyl-terminal processing protease